MRQRIVTVFGGTGFLGILTAVSRLPVIPLFGDGRMLLQPVHVDDVATAIERLLEMPPDAGKVFELGGARTYRYREILQALLPLADWALRD